MDEAIFEALDARVALLRGPDESPSAHLLGDVLKHVPVFQAALQRAGLQVRPGRFPAHVGQLAGGRLLD